MEAMPAWRSLLFAPGHDRAKIEKAARSGADAVIVDLEDGVPGEGKQAARDGLREAAALIAAVGAAPVVRINAGWRAAALDLDAAVDSNVRAIMVSKTESAARLLVLDEMVSEIEAERGIPVGSIGFVALLESPGAIGKLDSIAASPRVIGMALGTEDFSLALGVEPSAECLDLPCRSIALAAASRGLMSLAMPISIAVFRDDPAVTAAATLARRYGASGGLAIHPGQARIYNEVFVSSPAEVEKAERIVAAWDAAQKAGAAVTALSGEMIDLPVVERARRTLSRRGSA